MLSLVDSDSVHDPTLDRLDRLAIAYLTLPVVVFVVGWFEWWAALPLVACIAYGLRPLIARRSGVGTRLPVTPLQLTVALIIGCGWTFFGGTDHLVFANADWHIRDAVLHDLVVSPWPVGYGLVDGKESLLRVPIAYYLPAAIVGKLAGLSLAHFALAVWTAIGTTLFLLQVLSLTRSRLSIAILVATVVVFFSGLDIVGNLLNDGPRFRSDWNITTHLEWWAGTYQYSSMTTQLFWVPNHALGGWLMIGLLYRDRGSTRIDVMLPMLVVAVALWSPLTVIGLAPFVLWKVGVGVQERCYFRLLHPNVWAPALAVGLVVASYLALDPSRIPKGIALASDSVGDATLSLLRQAQFFLLEAGFIGFAILVMGRSREVVLALFILAVLPFAYLGPGNDLVMRASIPSLAVLTIGACLALIGNGGVERALPKKALLCGLLVVGAVTPFAEFARAAMLPAWPINMRANLIGADCGHFAPHYVAKLRNETITHLLRRPHRVPVASQGRAECENPALELMWRSVSPVNSKKLRPAALSNEPQRTT